MAVRALPVTAVFLAVFSLFASCTAKQNCSEMHCELIPVGEDFASEFQFKASEKGVRMVYLNLMIGNDSYHPLELGNEFLPERWVWASSIGELMLSLSYDYDILSLGLLKNQVRKMSVQLKDQPSGCLASLNSSCQNRVVGKVLLGNVTASSAKKFRQDVVCVAEIDDHMNSLENFFEGDIEYRCCKVVKQGLTDSMKCEQRVERSIWFNAFYVVLNILTVFVAIYLPTLLLALPDFIFNLRKEYEKEKIDKYDLKGPWDKFLDVMAPLPGSNTENIPLVRITPGRPKARKPTRFKKEDEIPIDDGSPFTFSTLFQMCNSEVEAFQGLVMFSFNLKLLILWYCVMPFFVYVELTLFRTLKDEFSEEISTKSKAWLVGKLFFLADMSKLGNRVTLILSYFILPTVVITILKKGDFVEKEKPCPLCTEKTPRYIGKEVWNHLEIAPKIINSVFPFVVKFPIRFWLAFQICCSNWISEMDGFTRFVRFICSGFVLLLTTVTLLVTAAVTAIVWFGFLIIIIVVLVICTPQFTVLIFFFQKGLKKPICFISLLVIVGIGSAITLILKFPLTYPFLWIFFSLIYPLFLGLHFCRFIVRMFGFTIIGLTFNAEIAAPLVAFIWFVSSNMYECLCNFQSLYKDVKKVIYQEWKKGVEELDENVKPESTNGTIPLQLFWYVCNEVLPVRHEAFRLFCNVAVIFLSSFFALSAIFFGTNTYQIPTVASTVAVYFCGKFPMLILREMHKLHFSGWEEIERNEKIKISVQKFIINNYGPQRKRSASI